MKMRLYACLLLAACGNDTVTADVPQIRIVPLPTATQSELSSPPGIDFGEPAIWGVHTATFRVDNESRATLRLTEAAVEDLVGANITSLDFPLEVGPRETGACADPCNRLIRVGYSPLVPDGEGSATVVFSTNAGDAPLQLSGIGKLLGEPNLSVCYVGGCYQVPEDCTPIDGVCVLPPLDFGNVQLDSTATQQVRLQNIPPAGQCVPAPGDEACTPVCVVSFAPGASALGVGLSDATQGFRLEGNIPLPFQLGTDEPQCLGFNDVLRRDLPLSIAFDAGSIEALALSSRLVLESDQPGAARIDIPLSANARQGPTAVATLRACGDENPPPACSNEGELKPLERVYFDGSDSFDSSQPDNPSAIIGYSWQVIEAPAGADVGAFDFNGTDTTPQFSMFLPIAGRYIVRLTVTSSLGIESGVSPTSDVIVDAIPDSRASVQVVWDSPFADLDLHLVSYTEGDMVYSADSDCFWKNCKSSCTPQNDCQPIAWDASEPPFEGPNPRLDVDDTNGLGPENTSLNQPLPGRYRIYVHYYTLVSPEVIEPTTATVRLYIDGQLRAQYDRQLDPSDLWRVAQIEWLADGSSVITEATSDAEGETGAVKPLTTMPYPTGYAFGSTF